MHLLRLLLTTSTATAFVLQTPLPTATSPHQNIPRSTSELASVPTGYFQTTKHVIIPGMTNALRTQADKTINIVVPTCIQTIAPDQNGYVPPGTCGSLYNYYPSFVGALIFSLLFGTLTIGHIVQASILKSKFSWVVIMGAIWETMSFVFRSISTKNQLSSGIALISTIFVLLAPLWVNAYAYMVLARMIHAFHPYRSIFSIPASIMSIVFVTLDIVSFVIQLFGGSYATPSDPVEKQMKGIHIYMGGIAIQQFFIFVFLAIAVKFHLEMKKLDRGKGIKPGWTRLIWTLYASLGFVTVRIFFRLIEFSAGRESSNPLPFHEAYFYALEAVPMFCAIVVFNITHPSGIMRGPDAKLPGIKALWRGGFQKMGPRDAEEMLVMKAAPYTKI